MYLEAYASRAHDFDKKRVGEWFVRSESREVIDLIDVRPKGHST